MSVPAGTRFIGIQPGVDMVERKSSQANSPTEVYTIEDIQSSGVPYVGATQDVDLGEYELKAGQIELDQSPTGTAGVAVTRWNNTIGSTETTLKGGSVILKNGVDLVARVVNKVSPNATLTKAAYQVVKISGAQGQRLAVDYAQANNDNNSADTLGVVIETIPTNQEGFIMTVGQLEGVNTSGSLQGETWLDGDVLYLSPTVPGAVTKVKPTGATGHIVVIGYVEHAHNVNGKIYVKIMNGWELDELHNVYINPATLANNQVLTYESATQLWKNKTPETGITVSTTPSTGVNGRVFFQAGGVVQQSDRFTFDNTTATNILQLGSGANAGVSLRTIAPGATNLDIAFRVRNSADTLDILQVRGDTRIIQNITANSATTYAGFNVAGENTDTYVNAVVSGNQPMAVGFRARSGNAGNSIQMFADNGNVSGVGSASTHIWHASIGYMYFGNMGGNAIGFKFGASNGSTLSNSSGMLGMLIKSNVSSNQSIFTLGTYLGTTTSNPSSNYGGNTFFIANGTAPTATEADTFGLYSADITAGNAAPHFRTENGNIIKLYRETTAVGASTLVSNAGTTITDTDTFDGYTLKQIVKALRNQGLLA